MSRNRTFALAASIVAVAVVGAAWATGLRAVAHDALLALLVFAFLPILITVAVLGILLCVSLVLGLASGGETDVDAIGDLGQGVGEGGFWLSKIYYRFLARQRHPVLLGSVAGFVLGVLLLWLFIGVFVFPKEMRTAALLAQDQAAIENHYKNESGYPRANG